MPESKNGTTRNLTDSNIRNTFGTFEDFMITSMASQLDSLGFINEGSTKRKEILAKFLDLQMFEEKHKLAKKDSAELRGIIKHLSSVDWYKKLAHGNEALEEIKSELEEQVGKCEKIKNRINVLSLEQQVVEDQLRSVENGWYNISEVEAAIHSKQHVNESNLAKIKKAQDKIPEYDSEISNLENIISLIDSEMLRSQLDVFSNLEKDKKELEYELKTVRSKLKDCNNKIKILGNHRYDPDCTFCCDNQFVKEAQEAKKKAPNFVKEISDIENQIGSLHNQMAAINIENINDRLLQHSESIKNKNVIENKIDKLGSNIKIWLAQNDLLENEVAELIKKRDHYYEHQEAFENVDSLKRDLLAMNKKIKELKDMLKRCEKKTMSLNTEQGATKQQVKEAEEKIAEIKNFEKDYIAYDLFIQAMHPNGVSYQVIKSMMSIINFEISKILNNIVDFEVFFDNIGNKLEIYIKHPRFDPRPLSMGSGAEKTIASMAIRLALISITNLPKSEIFILDEPATALDAEHMDGFIRLLQMIKAQFKTVLLISHLESLKDIVDMTIDIQKKDGYANVKI